MTIKRIWHGWTRPEDADAYARLLDESIVPGIAARRIEGHRSTEIFRQHADGGDEVEFVTIMTFDTWAAVEAFAGGDGTGSVVPAAARRLLSRFDEHSSHFEVVSTHRSPGSGDG